MRIFLLVIFIFCSTITFGQKSQLYNSKGILIVDSTFRISKKQLKKFTAIEKPLIDSLLKILVYPGVYQYHQISFNMVLSFALDETGEYDEVKMEKVSDSRIPLSDKTLNAFMGFELNKSRGKYNEDFKAKKGKKETYYIPFKFIFDAKKKTETEEVISGWLVKTAGEVKMDEERPTQCPGIEVEEIIPTKFGK